MITRFYDTDIREVANGRYEVSWPAFRGVVVPIAAPDRDEACARSAPWLVGCILKGWEDN